MKMNINVEITDPDVIGEIFALFGRSKTAVDMVVTHEDMPPRGKSVLQEAVEAADTIKKIAEEMGGEVVQPRNATPPPPPPADPEPEPAPKKRGRPKAEPEQIAIPAGEVTQSQFSKAVNDLRTRWGIEAARGILREVAKAEKPDAVPPELWSAVVDACNAYKGADALDMSEFL